MSDPIVTTDKGGPAHVPGSPPDPPMTESAATPKPGQQDTGVQPRVPPPQYPVPPGYYPMRQLNLDGRVVRFHSISGITYDAPALTTSITTESQAAMIPKAWGRLPDNTWGYWPDVRFVPDGWQELPTDPTAVVVEPRAHASG
jgi:hypothetical protein